MSTKGSDSVRVATDYAIAPYISEAVQVRLGEQASRLFVKENEAALDFLDLEDNAEGVQSYRHCPSLLTLIAARLLARADQ